MVLIGELIKALNIYSNPGVGNHSHMNKNFNARGASKKFWMQNVQSKSLSDMILVLLCSTLCDHCYIYIYIYIYIFMFYFVSRTYIA